MRPGTSPLWKAEQYIRRAPQTGEHNKPGRQYETGERDGKALGLISRGTDRSLCCRDSLVNTRNYATMAARTAGRSPNRCRSPSTGRNTPPEKYDRAKGLQQQ
uniref:Uncharacterized protein n=1 Tax=Trichuris muris TaxID=70415 RepID=A0A5S6QK56_TRIMR